MRAELPPAIVVTPDKEVSSLDVQKGNYYRLRVETDSGSGDVALNFSTPRAMYDFAVSLLQEAVYGTSGQQEFVPDCLSSTEVHLTSARPRPAN